MKLKETHPNLYFAVIVFGLWGILTSLNMLLTDPIFPSSDAMKYFFAAGYMIFGTMKLIGARRPTIEIARAGMIGCMLLSTLFSMFSLISFLNGELRALYTTINFFFLGLIQMAAISEPMINPMSMRKSKRENE